MEEAKLRVVQRPQVENVASIPAEASRQGMSWRKISLLVTPVVVALINLVGAYVSKRQAFHQGDREYRTAIESAQVTAANILAAAEASGRITADTRHAQGVKEGKSIRRRGASVAAETIGQGLDESAFSRLKAEQTRDGVKKSSKTNPLDKY